MRIFGMLLTVVLASFVFGMGLLVFKVWASTPTYYFYDEINSSSALSFVKALDNTLPYSNLTVYVNSPGGKLPAVSEIVEAIKRAQARNITISMKVSGMAASGAAVILCYADKVSFTKDSIILFHAARRMLGPNLIIKNIRGNLKTKDELLNYQLWHGLTSKCNLTEREMVSIFINGDELFFKGNELNNRILRR